MHSPFQQIFAVLCFTVLSLTSSAATAESALNLKSIGKELYQFSNDEGNSGVVLITSEGAVVGDALDKTTAESLNAHLASEFQTSVKYVFYTHTDAARAAGTQVHADAGALVIGHANALHSATIIDGLVSSPDLVFTQSMSVRIGDQSVTLEHVGSNVSDHMLVARFAWQKTVFAADFVAVESLPLVALDKGFFPDWFLSIDRLSKLDFAYLLDGQGGIGNRTDAKQHEYYLRELYTRVDRALKEEQTEAQMLEEITMAKYRNWNNYAEALPENIKSMRRALQAKP